MNTSIDDRLTDLRAHSHILENFKLSFSETHYLIHLTLPSESIMTVDAPSAYDRSLDT